MCEIKKEGYFSDSVSVAWIDALGKNEFHYRRQEREDGKSKRREVAFPATGARIFVILFFSKRKGKAAL